MPKDEIIRRTSALGIDFVGLPNCRSQHSHLHGLLGWAVKERHIPLLEIVSLLIEKRAKLKIRDAAYGQTPLSWAAEKGHEAVVKLMLEKGADLESKDKFGQTPLSRVAEMGHEAVVKLLSQNSYISMD
jgi:ankyrin repeat protein